EVRVALSQIESAKLLLVGGEPVRVVGIVRLKEAEETAGLVRVHLLAQPAGREVRVAENVDGSDLGEVALVDLEHHVDAILVELDDLRFDTRGESALAAVEFKDPIDVGADRASSEDLARRQLDLRRDLVVLEALVALKNDAVDDRIFADVDDQ